MVDDPADPPADRTGDGTVAAPPRSSAPAGGAILVSNHASYIDAFVLMAALERRFALTVKAEVFAYPFVGRIARLLGHVPIFRSSVGGSLAAYRAAQEAASKGKIIHFFPEATFAWAAEIRRFRLGAFALAAEKGLPVYPVAIRGARRVLRDGEGMPRRAPLEVEVLAPLCAPATGRFEKIARLRETARAALGAAVGERLVESTSIALPEGTPLDPELSKIG